MKSLSQCSTLLLPPFGSRLGARTGRSLHVELRKRRRRLLSLLRWLRAKMRVIQQSDNCKCDVTEHASGTLCVALCSLTEAFLCIQSKVLGCTRCTQAYLSG